MSPLRNNGKATPNVFSDKGESFGIERCQQFVVSSNLKIGRGEGLPRLALRLHVRRLGAWKTILFEITD